MTLESAESIAVIRSALGERVAVGGVTDVDLALLHGPDRLATVQIAGRTAPARTASCTAAGTPAVTCTPTGSAAWTPATGPAPNRSPVTGASITGSDPDLRDIATRCGLTVH